MMSLLGCLAITEGYIVAYLATKLQKESYTIILIFLNHIIGIVSTAKRPFSVEEWSSLVVDKDFVPDQIYVDLLLQEVPIKLYNDVLINLFRNKSQGEGSHLNLIFHTMIEKLGIENARDFIEVVSEFLRTVQNDLEVKTVLQILPPIAWRQLNGVSRLRIENKLIKAIDIGQYSSSNDKCIHGWLGTWARDFVIYFELKENLFNVLLRKIRKGSTEADYVAKYFMSQLPNTIENTIPRAKTQTAQYVRALAHASFSYTSGSDFVRTQLFQLPQSWINLIKTEAGNLEDLNQEVFEKFAVEEDDLPF